MHTEYVRKGRHNTRLALVKESEYKQFQEKAIVNEWNILQVAYISLFVVSF